MAAMTAAYSRHIAGVSGVQVIDIDPAINRRGRSRRFLCCGGHIVAGAASGRWRDGQFTVSGDTVNYVVTQSLRAPNLSNGSSAVSRCRDGGSAIIGCACERLPAAGSDLIRAFDIE